MHGVGRISCLLCREQIQKRNKLPATETILVTVIVIKEHYDMHRKVLAKQWLAV